VFSVSLICVLSLRGEDCASYCHSLTLVCIFLLAPSRPDPPVVGKVTHYSIELYWKRPSQGSDKISYCIQEEESSAKGGGFGAVYKY